MLQDYAVLRMSIGLVIIACHSKHDVVLVALHGSMQKKSQGYHTPRLFVLSIIIFY